ncbi:MAG: amidase [Polyangiaceae bacterium]
MSGRGLGDLLRLSGAGLAAVERLSAMPGAARVVRGVVNEALGISALRGLPDSFRGDLPDDLRPVQARAARRWAEAALPWRVPTAGPCDVAAWALAYARGAADPLAVAERALASFHTLARRTPAMNVVAASDAAQVLAAASASAERWKAGTPRALEGVPFLVKDQHDVAGLPTRSGSAHTPAPAVADATVVARLRAAGAVVLGKSVMTEWGISPLGNSVHGTLPKNPHDPRCTAGGSSTGSAVAVALGLGPFATGGDAGGSVRTPAAMCGVLGVKPTFGRLSRAGEAFSGTLAHLGLIGLSAADLAGLLDVCGALPDPRDTMTGWAAPPPAGGFGARLGDGVRGLRIGVDEQEWSAASPEVAALCRDALAALERDGAELVPVRVPLAPHAVAIGIATMGCEGVSLEQTAEAAQRALFAPDVRLAMNVARGVSARDYLDVQRLRVGLRRQTAAALRRCDVLALPVMPRPTPRLSDRMLVESFSDATLVVDFCRYAMLANLTGLPAAAAPVGDCASGLPVGLQIVGDAWDEATVLGAVAHLERAGVVTVRRPPGALDLLAGA